MKCYYCGRKPMVEGEGRIADSSWAADQDLPNDAKGAWFCCFNCYDRTLRDYGEARTYGLQRYQARLRRDIKRRLRKRGIEIPEHIRFNLKALRELEANS